MKSVFPVLPSARYLGLSALVTSHAWPIIPTVFMPAELPTILLTYYITCQKRCYVAYLFKMHSENISKGRAECVIRNSYFMKKNGSSNLVVLKGSQEFVRPKLFLLQY